MSNNIPNQKFETLLAYHYFQMGELPQTEEEKAAATKTNELYRKLEKKITGKGENYDTDLEELMEATAEEIIATNEAAFIYGLKIGLRLGIMSTDLPDNLRNIF